MVRIEKLVLQGFKSFKRNVSIPFPVGFSVITGPNGSGKSNIADAISFVLGKTSAKSLRARKTQELIFHGSKHKEASEYAKVTLHVDNSDRALPLTETWISIVRRINKSGISTYRLNGKMVTRQEILDLLTQGGMQADGHNFIQQGYVNEFVEMQPIERRGIIDEISGIGEYDEKKEKALKELEKVEEKIREAEIILEQKDQILEKLKNERSIALEYKRLQNLIELIKASLILKNLNQAEQKLQRIKQLQSEKSEEAEKIETEIKELDNKLTQQESRLEKITQQVLQASDQLELSRKLTELKSTLQLKKEKIKLNELEIERLDSLIDRLSRIDKKVNPAVKSVLGMKGVHGTLSNLIIVPKQYKIAVEVAAASHLQDVVVDSYENAIRCVKYLKANKIGRARFLPLDRIKTREKRPLPLGSMGWLSDLIHHSPEYTSVVKLIFGATACINDLDKAKAILQSNKRVRMVTLDGDLIEPSGAIVGGYYRKKALPELSAYLRTKKELERENERLKLEIEGMKEKLKGLAVKEKYTKITSLENERIKIDELLKKLRAKRKKLYEKRLEAQQAVGKLNIQSARIEATLESSKLEWERFRDKLEIIQKSELLKDSTLTLKQKQADAITKLESLGAVNLKAIDEFESFKQEFDEFKIKVDKVVEEKRSIENTINKIEAKKREVFILTLNKIAKHFRLIYSELTGGDASLKLEDENNLESGLLISASPGGKRLLSIDALSGGEKTLTAFAFLFAVQKYKPAPFYVLDETDTTLDKTNTKKVAELIKRQSKLAQFIIISHNDDLIREADQVYGITMEDGESKILGIKLPEV